MASTTECAAPTEGERALLPISPYCSLHHHFGMLLGVEDFNTEQGYHRGKMRLHNSWLHRKGVVWGLTVALDKKSGEVRVSRGLALDGAGQELYLEADACLNACAWLEANKDDPVLKKKMKANEVTFDAWIVMRQKTCLTRQVPALMEPCAGSGRDTAYSRVCETVEILLVTSEPTQPAPPYHRLRLLFGLDEPKADSNGKVLQEDQDILDERAALLASALGDRAKEILNHFRKLAAADTGELIPASDAQGQLSYFPALDDDLILLAHIKDFHLKKQMEGWSIAGGEVHNEVRPSHVDTHTMEELLCGALACCGSKDSGEGGPRIDPDSVTMTDSEVTFQVNAELHAGSLKPAGFSVSAFDETAGWKTIDIDPLIDIQQSGTSFTVTLKLNSVLAGKQYRFIARGTGPSPLLGTDFLPLAGAISDPPSGKNDGRDFVFMKQGS